MASYDLDIADVQIGGGSRAFIGVNNNNTTILNYSQYTIVLQ